MKKKITMAAVLAASTVSLLAATVAPAQAQDRDYYGAIAVSVSTGYYGWSYDYDSYASAEQAAVSRCISGGGGGDCAAKIAWRNGCGAIASSANYLSYGAGATLAAAKSQALANNPEAAHIEHWNCTTGYTL